MIYTFTMWLYLTMAVCIPVEIEGTVDYALNPDAACLSLAAPLAGRPDVAATWIITCVVDQGA